MCFFGCVCRLLLGPVAVVAQGRAGRPLSHPLYAAQEGRRSLSDSHETEAEMQGEDPISQSEIEDIGGLWGAVIARPGPYFECTFLGSDAQSAAVQPELTGWLARQRPA